MPTLRTRALIVLVAAVMGCGSDKVGPSPTLVLSLLSGDGQSGDPFQSLPVPFRVAVRRVDGTPVAGRKVSFEVVTGRGQFGVVFGSPIGRIVRVQTDAQGQAAAYWILGDSVEGQTARAIADGVRDPVVVAATAVRRITVRSLWIGPASATVGDTLAQPLEVEALDANQVPVPRARIQWQVETAGPVLLKADSLTDSTGRARAFVFAGPTAGLARISALSRSGAVTFSVDVKAGTAVRLAASPAAVTLPAPGTRATITATAYDRRGYVVPVAGGFATVADSSVVTSSGNVLQAVEVGRAIATFHAANLTVDIPVTVPAWHDVVVGAGSACGYDVTRLLTCWERDPDFPAARAFAPDPMGVVSFGGEGACYVATSGVSRCYGDNSLGQLGAGLSPATVRSRPANNPATVAGSHAWATVALGPYGACGLDVGGSAWCWGFADGLGSDAPLESCNGACSSVPVPVALGLTFRDLSLRFLHACGVTTVGEGYCWGLSAAGDLGSPGNDTCSGLAVRCARYPQRVTGTHTWQTISAALYHTCGLDTAGEAWCWGSMQEGALGNGVMRPDSSMVPVKVVGGLQFAQLHASGRWACGLTVPGKVSCWGAGKTSVPTPVLPTLSFTRIALAPGDVQVGCGLATTGAILCWNAPAPVPASARVR